MHDFLSTQAPEQTRGRNEERERESQQIRTGLWLKSEVDGKKIDIKVIRRVSSSGNFCEEIEIQISLQSYKHTSIDSGEEGEKGKYKKKCFLFLCRMNYWCLTSTVFIKLFIYVNLDGNENLQLVSNIFFSWDSFEKFSAFCCVKISTFRKIIIINSEPNFPFLVIIRPKKRAKKKMYIKHEFKIIHRIIQITIFVLILYRGKKLF